MRSVIHFFQDLGLMIARIALGIILVLHGWTRWDEGIEKQVAYLSEHDVWQPTVLAWGATALEVIGGALLVFGLATPLVALAVVVQNALVIAWLKLKNGWSVTDGGWEYNAMLAAFALVFVVFGSGRAGLDNVFRRPTKQDTERKVVRENP